jgi:hypothetical protein
MAHVGSVPWPPLAGSGWRRWRLARPALTADLIARGHSADLTAPQQHELGRKAIYAPECEVPGPNPARRDYVWFARFSDPDHTRGSSRK